MSETTDWLDVAHEKWLQCQTAARIASFRAGEAHAYAKLAEASALEARLELDKVIEKSKLFNK